MTQTQEFPHVVEKELEQGEGSREQEKKSSFSPVFLDNQNFAAMNGVNIELEAATKAQPEIPEPEEIVTTRTVSQNPILKMGVIGGGIFIFIMLIGGVINSSMNVFNMGTKIEPPITNQEKTESLEIVDETGQTKTALALTSQNSEFKKIRDQKAASSPTPTSSFTPVSVAPPPTPRTVQRTQPISVSRNPDPPIINYPTTRSSPVVEPQLNPAARVTPAIFTPVKAQETQPVDPMQQWLAAANVGSFNTNSTETTTNSSVLTDGIEGGAGTPKSLPLNKELSKNPTINSQNTDDNARQLLVGTRTEGKLETPIALNASNGQQGIQKFLIRLTKPLKASDGSEVLPVNSYLVVVSNNNASEYIQMSAIAALINIDGNTLEKPLTENSILILNKNGETLRAQSRKGSSLGSDYLLAAFSVLIPVLPAPTLADIPTVTYSQGKYKAQIPDWSRITWNSLPSVQKSGYLSIPQNLISVFGYDPSRSWAAGQEVDSVVMLGDADDAFKMSNFSLESIGAIAPTTNLTLKDLGLMQWQTPGSLVKAIPQLGNLYISQVPPLAELFSEPGEYGGTISQFIESNPEIANIPLSKLDLSKYSIDSIPGLFSTPLSNFQSWQQSFINQVPGLNQIPFNKMPQPINSGVGVVGIASVVLGTSERGDAKVGNNYFVSGSIVRGDAYGNPSGERTVPVACPTGEECSYMEMGDFTGEQGGLYGKRWASGSSQQVKGGYGFLAAVNGGKEPTGRLVYGSGFKVVLTGVDESKGTADFGLNFRICVRPPFMAKTCTPYFIGPIPWIPVNENNLVVVGTGR